VAVEEYFRASQQMITKRFNILDSSSPSFKMSASDYSRSSHQERTNVQVRVLTCVEGKDFRVCGNAKSAARRGDGNRSIGYSFG